jgi:hypothetical protein
MSCNSIIKLNLESISNINTLFNNIITASSNGLSVTLIENVTRAITNDPKLEALYAIFRKNKNDQTYCNLSCYLTSLINKIQKVYELTSLYMWDNKGKLIYKSTIPKTNTYSDYIHNINLDNSTILSSFNAAKEDKNSLMTNQTLNMTYYTFYNSNFKFAITLGAVIPNRIPLP